MSETRTGMLLSLGDTTGLSSSLTKLRAHFRLVAVTLPVTCETGRRTKDACAPRSVKPSFASRYCTPAIVLPSAGGVTSKRILLNAGVSLRHWPSEHTPFPQSVPISHLLYAMVLGASRTD